MNKLFLFFVFILAFTFFSYLFVDQNFIFLKSLYTGFYKLHRVEAAILYALLVFIFYFFYLLFLAQKFSLDLKKILLFVFFFLVFSYPAMLSFDIFNYLATAKVTYLYRENPYFVMPIEFAGDPSLLFTRAANKYALYGPTWIGLTGIPYLLGFNSFITQMFLFKIMTGIFYLGTVYVISRLTKKNNIIFFALNPLVLIETFVSGHNDIVMIFLALVSFYFLKQKKFFFSFIFLTASIFVKFSTILLFPAVLYVLLQYLKKKTVNWNNVWLFSSGLMFFAFLLAPLREEIYPWYAIWFLVFITMLEGYRNIKVFAVSLSLGLSLSYTPYVLLGHYSNPTPLLKTIFIITPVILTGLYFLYKKYDKSN